MIITKIYNQKLDLKNTYEIYGSLENVCIKLLKKIYEGKCFQNTYILEIEKIIRKSDVIISSSYLDVRGCVWVEFLAKAIFYAENDLIANCKIRKKKEGRVFATIDNGEVFLINHELLKMTQEGQTIPIRVKRAGYQPFKNSISIFAIPYVEKAPTINYIYVLKNSITELGLKKIENYSNTIKDLKKKISDLKPPHSKYFKDFEQLFYPFKKQEKPPILSANKEITLLNFITLDYSKLKTPVIIIPSFRLNKSSPFVLKADPKSLKSIESKTNTYGGNWSVVEEDTYILFEALLLRYIKYNEFLINMALNYTYKADNGYWKAIMSYKI